MELNQVPAYDMSKNETNCCPRFNPQTWEGQELHFKNKLFVKANTRSLFHFPLNIGPVFTKTFGAIQAAKAQPQDFVVLSKDPSAFKGEHYFSVTKEVPGQDNVTLTGDYITHVFEGPYKNAPKWVKEMNQYVASKGKTVKDLYFFYTTCPKCAAHYGKNYVVGVAQTN